MTVCTVGHRAAAALLVAIARVYVGAHWSGDVAAGLLEGVVIALLGCLPIHNPWDHLEAEVRRAAVADLPTGA
jgi:membrane-associated phospholipid phosphatase